MNLSFKKASKNGDIPAKALKKSVYIYKYLDNSYKKSCIEKEIFPDDLKLADLKLSTYI